jgi:hypothetical protein
VVYAKPPFGGPQQVLEYLGRYTHRGAISNERLLALQDGQVSFRWKDYRRPEQPKVMTVSAEEFIRPLSAAGATPRVSRAFAITASWPMATGLASSSSAANCWPLRSPTCSPRPTDYRDFYAALTGWNPRLCPQCGIGTMIRIQILGPGQAPAAIGTETS